VDDDRINRSKKNSVCLLQCTNFHVSVMRLKCLVTVYIIYEINLIYTFLTLRMSLLKTSDIRNTLFYDFWTDYYEKD